jgi:hypothetical protein
MTYVCEQVCVVFHIIASPRPVVIANRELKIGVAKRKFDAVNCEERAMSDEAISGLEGELFLRDCFRLVPRRRNDRRGCVVTG